MYHSTSINVIFLKEAHKLYGVGKLLAQDVQPKWVLGYFMKMNRKCKEYNN